MNFSIIIHICFLSCAVFCVLGYFVIAIHFGCDPTGVQVTLLLIFPIDVLLAVYSCDYSKGSQATILYSVPFKIFEFKLYSTSIYSPVSVRN